VRSGFLERLGEDHVHGNVHRAVGAELGERGSETPLPEP
jgi:hypothetical protein